MTHTRLGISRLLSNVKNSFVPAINLNELPKKVNIVEVGPRDGLQNEKIILSTNVKKTFVNMLSETGLRSIEVCSFVSKRWIPQMFDAKGVFTRITKHDNIEYIALVPNEQGLDEAFSCQVKNIAIFATPSETFCRKNMNRSVTENYEINTKIVEKAIKNNVKIRGYISCTVDCPYEGSIDPNHVIEITKQLLDMGCYEVALGDTTGTATPNKISRLLQLHLKSRISPSLLAGHFHNTYGQGIVNVLVALCYGVSTFDGSVSGLGGCPYSPGATGNLPTEDLVYMLDQMGIYTGINLVKLIKCGQYISSHLKIKSQSNTSNAFTSKI